MRLERFFLYIAYGQPEKGAVVFLNILLFPFYLLSLLYGLAVRTRIVLFRWGLKKTKTLPCKVISVGNVNVGGTGKTPVVEFIARRLSERGLKVAILSRGYKGKHAGPAGVVSDGKAILMTAEEAGDEPFMLARRLGNVPVIIGRDRYETGRYALKHFPVHVLVMDDAYQHIRLERDVNVLLVDGERGFGNGYLFPRGPLREPLSNVDRADIVLATKYRPEAQAMLDSLQKKGDFPVFKSSYEALRIKSLRTGKAEAASFLAGKAIVAFSGIANPSSFAALLRSLGGRLLHEEIFSDHHDYRPDDIKSVRKKAESLKADMIVTTEKDAVKIEGFDNGFKMPFYCLQIELKLLDGDDLFINSLLAKCGIRET